MRNRIPIIGTFSPALFVRWYSLLLLAACFGWPLVLGIGTGLLRFIWLIVAILLVGFSVYSARHAAEHIVKVTYRVARPPWLFFIVAGVALGIMLIFPVTFFGDEDLIALPSLIIASKLANVLTWPGLMVIVVALTWIFRLSYRHIQDWHVLVFAVFVLISSAVLAVLHTHPETLIVRYPFFMNFIQFIVTVLTQGSPELFRMGNVFWVVTLGFVGWYAASDWPPSARIATAVTLCLTPLGWTYHILLYQACGELTIGLLATLLLGKLLKKNNDTQSASALLLGSIFSFWILYRPTAFVLAGAAVVLLLVCGRKRAAWTVGSIGLPIGVLWLMVYVLGSFQYPFLSTESTRSFQLLAPFIATLKNLPDQLHPIGLLLLLVGGAYVAWKRPTDRNTLLVAWVFAVLYTGLHQFLTIDEWYGYGRFNVLLMLPLAVTIGSIIAAVSEKNHVLTAITLLLPLILATPWSNVGFLQSYRAVSYLDMMERTVTGGVSPSPLPRAMNDFVPKADTLILISPSSSFLDLLIARGKLSIAQRTAILERSKLWKPNSTARPVLIQAPTEGYTFRINIPKLDEQRLIDAAAWARKQPGLMVYRLGHEEALVVP